MVQATIIVKAKNMESLDKAILEIYKEIGDIKNPPTVVVKDQTGFAKGESDFCYIIDI